MLTGLDSVLMDFYLLKNLDMKILINNVKILILKGEGLICR